MEKTRDFLSSSHISNPEEKKEKSLNDVLNNMMNLKATPFYASFTANEGEFFMDNEGFFAYLISRFQEINKLSVPIKFKKNETDKHKPLLMIFGEMGNGKSTTGNAIIKD